MEANKVTETPQTPQTPLIELNKKIIKIIFIIFIVINFYFPCVNIIIEIILIAVNHYDSYSIGLMSFELFIYFLFSCGLIIFSCCEQDSEYSEDSEDSGSVLVSPIIIIIFFIIEIIFYFLGDYEKNYPDEFTNFIAKIRIIGFFITLGNIIIVSIIAILCYKRLGFSNE